MLPRDVWKTHDEALAIIMKELHVDKEKAEELLEQFKKEVPHAVVTTTMQ